MKKTATAPGAAPPTPMADRERQIAALRVAHADQLRAKTDALLELATASFNNPRAHDVAHSSAPFRRWRECSERARLIEVEIARIER